MSEIPEKKEEVQQPEKEVEVYVDPHMDQPHDLSTRCNFILTRGSRKGFY